MAGALKKSFGSFAKDAKGTERGGININLLADGRTIAIGATKMSFINVVKHKISNFNFSGFAPEKKVEKKKPTVATNVFDCLEEKKITHLEMFGRYRVPIPAPGKKSSTFRIQGGGGRIGSHEGITKSELHEGIQALILHQKKPSEKNPRIGNKNTPAIHSWTDTSKVSTGNGEMYNPPRPAGWFGLADMEDRSIQAAAEARLSKIETKSNKRRAAKDETDEDGNIVDLQEYLRARNEEDEEALAPVYDQGDDMFEFEEPDDDSWADEREEIGDVSDVPDYWDDEP